jgi:tRNA threonylcarbamoyladenosine modification (KEOPS) complex  Pcc1 subunit
MKSKSSRAEAEILLKASPEEIHVLERSLKPETETRSSFRSNVTIEPRERGMLIRILAEDSVALRAAVNSYLRWAQGVIEILNNLEA